MWTVTLIAFLLVLFYLYRKKNFTVLKDLGIPGPEPNILFGNYLELTRKGAIQCHKEWMEKYGKVVGYYFGSKPIIVVADVELLKKIQVSDFHKFMNRPSIFGGREKKPGKEHRVEGFSQQLISLRDKRWKDIRSIITPSFTTAKMKLMAPIMNDSIDSLLTNVEKKSKAGESFDIYPMYQGLTMDVIGRTAFGIQTDVQNNPNDPFLRSVRVLLSGDSSSILSIISVSFRGLEKLWSIINRMRLMSRNKGTNPVRELIESTKNVIALRREGKKTNRPDLLQLMIDAKIDDSAAITTDDLTAKSDNESTESQNKGISSGKLVRRMTDDDILDNSLLFFLAGYETTSTALAFTTHLLLHHPEVQERAREEVLELLKNEGQLDYYSVSKLEYLDQVLHEGLRMYPPVHLFVNRECSEDMQLGNFRLKKGSNIQVPVFNLHRDPDLWEDPDEFKPERFAPENKSKIHPMAFQSFGAGPRNCVGMRFALMEAKLALAKLLAKYKLKACAETDTEPVTLKLAFASMKPKHGVFLKAIPL
ncbi:cytochrome P450 3A24-like [Uloborus diversus]|uniref:cytochrome P450 3A24-like n=1 Tax=Uloborus diversus TaxID=327109 RepID=UPI0024094E6D|nr:cytochrome P450 3A24-like [Uloborus diversus]